MSEPLAADIKIEASATPEAKRRTRSILAFFATSLAARGIGIGCQLVQVPIALDALGSEAFGLWITLQSIGFMLMFADFGIGLGAQNQIAEAVGTGDDERARRVCVTSLAFLSGIMLVLLAIVVPVCSIIDWQSVFKLREPATIAAARPTVLITAVFWCLGLPLGFGQRLAYGAQLGWLHNVSQCVNNVLLLGAVFAAANVGASIRTFIVLAAALPAAVNLVLLVVMLRRLHWLPLQTQFFSLPVLRQLANVGIFFALQQVASLVLFTAPPIILSSTAGVAAVTPFNLAQRVFSLFLVLANAYLLPIWPAYSEAKGRGDWPWIQRTLKKSILAVFCLTVIPMAAATGFMPQIIQLWTGGQAELPTLTLLWLLFAWNGITVLQQPFGYLLAGLSEIRRATVYSIATTAVALSLMFVLAPKFGAAGVVLGLLFGFIPFVFAGTIIESVRVLSRMRPAAT
jgi:O-antigen/teichoic acid export membrane protein